MRDSFLSKLIFHSDIPNEGVWQTIPKLGKNLLLYLSERSTQ
jgi:hypothetical protein